MWNLLLVACLAQASPAAPSARPDLPALLAALQAVRPDGGGHTQATRAWKDLALADAARLPEVIAGLDHANPLAANWIRAAVDAIAERQLQRGGPLPAAGLERFVRETSHAPRARRLAFEWLAKVDRAAPDRLIPGMLDDPSLEMRRDAVARLVQQAADREKAGDREKALAIGRRALTAARDPDQIRTLAGLLRGLKQPVDLPRHFGFVQKWKLVGPFDNAGGKGFDAVYPPEKAVDFAASYVGKHASVRWTDYQTSQDMGEVDLNKPLGEEKAVVGYAASEFFADRAQPAEIRMASYNAVKAWLNGSLVLQHPVYHSGSQLDQHVAPVTLRPGRNLILLKICQNEQTQDWAKVWGFQLRVCDAIGTPILSIGRAEKHQADSRSQSAHPASENAGLARDAKNPTYPSRLGKQVANLSYASGQAASLTYAGRRTVKPDENDWRQFRGNDGRGSSSAQALPREFNAKTLAWKTPLPGPGPSGPIVTQGSVIATAASGARQDRLHVLALDVRTGKPRWERQLWATGSVLFNPFGGVAASTPASDGRRIAATFSSNDVACFDLEGNLLWFRGLGYENRGARNDVGLASSPLLVRDTVILQIETPGESFATGLDAATGQTRWRMALDRDAAWTSPMVLRGNTEGEDLALLQCRARLVAVDPASGEQVAAYEHWTDTVATGTTLGDVVFLPADGVRAVRLNRPAKRFELVWHSQRLRTSSASLVAGNGRVCGIKSPGILVLGDAATGELLLQTRLTGPFWATPVLADGHAYTVNHAGEVSCVDLTGEGKKVGGGSLEKGILATPAVAEGALFFRSGEHLWKFASEK